LYLGRAVRILRPGRGGARLDLVLAGHGPAGWGHATSEMGAILESLSWFSPEAGWNDDGWGV